MKKTAPLLLRAAALVVALTAGHAHAASAALDFLFPGDMPPASERVVNGVQRIWKIGEFTALRLTAKTDGSAPNEQPAALDPAVVQTALLSVQFESSAGVWKPLFAASDIQDIGQALTKALALATPQDDVLLMASARYDGALLGLQRSVLARLFVNQGALNILVKDARAELLASYRVSNTLPVYDFGSRHIASTSRISSAGAEQLRADWLALDLKAKTRSAVLAPSTLSAPPATAARDKAFFEQQAQRLEGLKSLLDKGLLSNAEYQQKRGEILQTL